MTPSSHGAAAGFRGQFRTDDAARAAYSEAAGIGRIMPRAVAEPLDGADVVALVRWAHEGRVPLVPRGSGSSMAGGAIGDGVIVDLTRLDHVGPVERSLSGARLARPGLATGAVARCTAGPGALCATVDAAAAALGLRFPVDPSSGAYCTVGGMAATNAAGPHSMRAGAMRRWVIGLDCVFDDGSRAWIRRGAPPPVEVPAVSRLLAWAAEHARTPMPVRAGVRKESGGYALPAWRESGELVDLLVGSEGTLALFVGLELALDERPVHTATVLAAFATLDGTTRGAALARTGCASACELLDRTFLEVAEEGRLSLAIPPGSEAVLLAEVEVHDAGDMPASAGGLAQRFRDAGATMVVEALRPADEHALWALRHAASPILARLDPSLASMQFIEDGCVPPERLGEYVRGVREALARHGTRGVIFGHAGDAHVHVNPLVDLRRPGWRDTVVALLAEVVSLTRRLGGTLAGEHGDGRLRAPLTAASWPADAAALFAGVKAAADPAGILNPGTIVPLAGQQAIEAVKYDPSLPALPAAARAALDRVAMGRAYATSRLALVDDPAAAAEPAAAGVTRMDDTSAAF
ncbi:MAG: FAD-binding oxidoreductase [Gemmatimonadetes bacterium]|nr:FAD-binding oxidoreductase [Gemmatimonadota bacterium]